MGKYDLVKNGIDNPDALRRVLTGKRLGLITGPTGVDRRLRATSAILFERYHLTCLFAPEHGLRGEAQAGDLVQSSTDPDTGLPVYSLYQGHEGGQLTAERLAALDAVVFDIQDVGARFYTYLYTMTDAMIACAAAGKEMIVLDRVNPLGLTTMEGALLDERFASFVGRYAVPTRYALTIGEFARYINKEKNIDCALTVVPCLDYGRDTAFSDTGLCWIMPSPNMPSPITALAYIGTCLFEGTNLSEGRGTTKPFEFIGAPWLDARKIIAQLPNRNGALYSVVFFRPTFSKYQGELCEGIQLHIIDKTQFSPFAEGLRLLQAIRKTHREFSFLPSVPADAPPFITRLLGHDAILREDFDTDCFIASQSEALEAFKKKSISYFLY